MEWGAQAVIAACTVPLTASAAALARIDGRSVGLAFVCLSACAVALAVGVSPNMQSAAAIALAGAAFSYLSAFDARSMSIPVWPTVLLALAGFVFSDVADLWSRCLAAMGGVAAFAALAMIFRQLRGVDGLGSGDALVAGAIGAWLSFEGLAWSVALGGVIGVMVQLARGAARDAALPFVPALSGGAGIYWVLLGRLQ